MEKVIKLDSHNFACMMSRYLYMKGAFDIEGL